MGLVISNGIIALSGALISQQDGYADVSKGIGVIVIGLASIIIGEVLYATKLDSVGTFDCHLYWLNPLSVPFDSGYCSWL